MKLQPIDSFRT